MAFITKDEVKEIRNKIKAICPAKDGWKFSVTGGNTSTICVLLKQYPANYNFPEYKRMNTQCMEGADLGDKELRVMEDIMDIITKNHWDESDIILFSKSLLMTDYSNCAFYYNLHIGEWHKPAIAKAD